MPDLETTWVMDTLSRWIRSPGETCSCPAALDPDRLGHQLEQNRLLPLFQRMGIDFPDTPDWVRFRARLELSYQRGLLQSLQQLKSGQTLMTCLEKAGIKSLAIRGPFLAEDIYGDPAVRLSSDIDILVAPQDRRRAWKVCQEAGYRSLEWECPLWPLDKHRIHWRIQREGDPVVCELHWAVEPAYGVMTLDYGALFQKCGPTQQFVLLCLHAGEHITEMVAGSSVWGGCPHPPVGQKADGDIRPTPEVLRAAMDQGMLFRWLDVAMFLRKYGAAVDWEWVNCCVRDRRVGSSLVLCLKGVRDWFGMALPEAVERRLPEWEETSTRQRSTGSRQRLESWWEQRAARRLGLATALSDVLYYLFPHAPFFVPSHGISLVMKRVGHTMKAGSVLMGALISYVCFALVTGIRRPLMKRAMAVASVLFLPALLFAHEFGDDYGDDAASAASITVGSNKTGTIEIDTDQDWFKFQATNSLKEYVVTVTTGTLWNSTAGLAAPDGLGNLASTDSVIAASSRVSWIHVGPPATYFICVGGFAQFTTGTYSVVVNEQPFADANSNSIPDSWEMAYFGPTNEAASADHDKDGVSNLSEFLAGTDPTNAASLLAVTDLAVTGSVGRIGWQAAAYRSYRVEISTNLMDVAGWNYLGSVTNLSAIGSLHYDDTTTPLPQIRFYRVRCMY